MAQLKFSKCKRTQKFETYPWRKKWQPWGDSEFSLIQQSLWPVIENEKRLVDCNRKSKTPGSASKMEWVTFPLVDGTSQSTKTSCRKLFLKNGTWSIMPDRWKWEKKKTVPEWTQRLSEGSAYMECMRNSILDESKMPKLRNKRWRTKPRANSWS